LVGLLGEARRDQLHDGESHHADHGARDTHRRQTAAARRGRAKLIVLTRKGRAAIAAANAAIHGLESEIDELLGERGHRELRRLLAKILESGGRARK
jgi:hypothetical protein